MQTSPTQVDCTISIDSSGDLTIHATDNSSNSDTDTETNYIVDTVDPNIPSVSIVVTGTFSLNSPQVTFSSLDNV